MEVESGLHRVMSFPAIHQHNLRGATTACIKPQIYHHLHKMNSETETQQPLFSHPTTLSSLTTVITH